MQEWSKCSRMRWHAWMISRSEALLEAMCKVTRDNAYHALCNSISSLLFSCSLHASEAQQAWAEGLWSTSRQNRHLLCIRMLWASLTMLIITSYSIIKVAMSWDMLQLLLLWWYVLWMGDGRARTILVHADLAQGTKVDHLLSLVHRFNTSQE